MFGGSGTVRLCWKICGTLGGSASTETLPWMRARAMVRFRVRMRVRVGLEVVCVSQSAVTLPW